ncbi:LuxR C-terminal-related transcriptional regulator [Arthrobacter sp. zg-Y820]|uniref:helix-turn-helix transcriptional regulator n=2 Tax=Arthrobacter TaxID=1663 RepID=UPI0024E01CF0|nr:LuxR family transcriptional regulator [Arthrobacter sp. zg-Y820]WIB10332.1 LuxR C-terminal-related transcriptional regulator [Arthrobacter sp. zg-Y820]
MHNSIHQSYVRHSSGPAPDTAGPASFAQLPRPDGAPREDTMREDQAAPPRFVGRAAVTATILDRLAAGGGAGCILVGEPGSGKTALIHHVLRHCSSDTYVVHVRGSAFSGRTPFGALTFLLSELEPDVSSHPVLILRGLTRLIQERAQGRAVLLAVDNGEDLDEFSAMALSQMVLSRTAGLLACFRDFSKAPAEFTGLWREGILSRVDLEPLDLAETAELLAAELDAPVSGAAVADLQRFTGGNPHLLTLACQDYRDSGRLRRSGAVWVLELNQPAPAGRVAEVVLGRLASLTERQTALVRTVALADSMPLAAALHDVEPGEVDTLQEQGILAVDRQSVPRVRIRDAVLAGAVRLSLDATERRRLLHRLRSAVAVSPQENGAAGAKGTPESDDVDPAAGVLDPASLALWRLDGGESLTPGAAVAAARAANEAGDPAGAIRFLSARVDFGRSAEAVLELVAARMTLGEYGAAMAALSGYRNRGQEATPLEEVRLLLAENRVLCMAATGALSGGLPAGALPAGAAKKHDELLRQAEQRVAELAAAGTISRADTAVLDRGMILARAECNSTHGRFLENAAYLAPVHAGASGRDKGFRVLIGSWLCEALGMTDRQDDAVELAQEVERLLAEPDVSPGDRSSSFARIIHVYLAIGALQDATRLLAQQQAHGQPTLFPGMFGELGEGLLHAFAGDPEQALRCLVPAVAQLRLGGPESMIPLAAAAAAYCHALQTDRLGAEMYLKLGAKAADGGPWSVRRGARHFAALADAALAGSVPYAAGTGSGGGGSAGARTTRSPQTAARRFIDLAAHDHRRGAYSYELLSLLSAVRLGDLENLDRVLSVAAHQQGPFARICETYAKGAGSFDAQLLIQAAEMAEANGQVLFAREASERALAVASGAGDRATVRFIHRSRRGTATPGAVEGTDSAGDYLSALTSRERSIARMAAAGTSNKAIAAELNISVRTVEGHLYQVYSKLHVGSRRELAKIIADKSGERK